PTPASPSPRARDAERNRGAKAAYHPRPKREGTMEINQDKLNAFMGQMIGHMSGASIGCAIWLGDELGFYRELRGSGARTADSLADKTKCNRRLVREWLDGQAAAGLVAYDAAR